MSKFTAVFTVAFMLLGCFKMNDQKDSSSGSAALNVAAVRKPLNACLKIMIFTCAETRNPSPGACDSNSDFAARASLLEKRGDKKWAEKEIEECQWRLDLFEERAKISGFENAEAMVTANIVNKEALKKFEASIYEK